MILTTALQAVCDWLEINADSPAYDDSGGKTIKQVIQEANNVAFAEYLHDKRTGHGKHAGWADDFMLMYAARALNIRYTTTLTTAMRLKVCATG